MGIRKMDSMEEISVREWNRKEARRYLRNRIVVRVAWMIIGIVVVFVALCLLHEYRIIDLKWR